MNTPHVRVAVTLDVTAGYAAAVRMHVTRHVAANLYVAAARVDPLGVARDLDGLAIIDLQPLNVTLNGDVDDLFIGVNLVHGLPVGEDLAVDDGDSATAYLLDIAVTVLDDC